MVGPHQANHFVIFDEAFGQIGSAIWLPTVVGKDQFDLGPTQAWDTSPFCHEKINFRLLIVHQLCCRHFCSPLQVSSNRCCSTGEGIENPNLNLLFSAPKVC